MNSPPIRYPCSTMTPSSSIPERNLMTPLEQKLNQLSLSTMSRQLETTLTDAAARNLSAAATMEWLADMEIEARSQRAIERRFRSSRLHAPTQHRRLSLPTSQEPCAGQTPHPAPAR